MVYAQIWPGTASGPVYAILRTDHTQDHLIIIRHMDLAEVTKYLKKPKFGGVNETFPTAEDRIHGSDVVT